MSLSAKTPFPLAPASPIFSISALPLSLPGRRGNFIATSCPAFNRGVQLELSEPESSVVGRRLEPGSGKGRRDPVKGLGERRNTVLLEQGSGHDLGDRQG